MRIIIDVRIYVVIRTMSTAPNVNPKIYSKFSSDFLLK